MPHARRWSEGVVSDTGSASLEFITAGLILLVPLVYLVVTMSVLQGGAFAAEGAARQAARAYVQAPDEASANARAQRAVEFALADYGIAADSAEVGIGCASSRTGCLARLSAVTITVRIHVSLPLMPEVLSLPSAASIPVEATATQVVSRFWGVK